MILTVTLAGSLAVAVTGCGTLELAQPAPVTLALAVGLAQPPVGRAVLPLSADMGDASATLAAAQPARVVRWKTPLTAARSVTLGTAGAVDGDVLDIVRAPTATGVAPLQVGCTPAVSLPAGAWVRVIYDATAAAWWPMGVVATS